MKFKFITIQLLFVIFISSKLYSQEIIYNNDESRSITDNQEATKVVNNSNTDIQDNSKISYKIDLGSCLSASSLFGNSVSFYTTPQLRYKLNPKLNITAGVMFINTSISNYYMMEKNQKMNINQVFIFSGFDYNATEKLKISGEILYGNNKSPYTGINNSQNYFVKFSAEYKINENFSIGLQVINQNMGYPSYGNSFGRDPFGNYNWPSTPFNR